MKQKKKPNVRKGKKTMTKHSEFPTSRYTYDEGVHEKGAQHEAPAEPKKLDPVKVARHAEAKVWAAWVYPSGIYAQRAHERVAELEREMKEE